jgi:hypothetical protein
MDYRQFRLTGVAAAFGTALLAAGPAHAVDVDPGDYEAAPPGTNLLLGYGLFDWYNRFIDRSGHSVSDSHLQTQTGILRPVHFTDVFGINNDLSELTSLCGNHGSTILKIIKSRNIFIDGGVTSKLSIMRSFNSS